MVHSLLEDKVSNVDAMARDWARHIEDREAARSHTSLSAVRRIVARRIGVAPGTLENLRKGRAKKVAAVVFERLRAAVIREMEHELARCAHELQIALQAGRDPRSTEVAALEAAMVQARAMMERAP